VRDTKYEVRDTKYGIYTNDECLTPIEELRSGNS